MKKSISIGWPICRDPQRLKILKEAGFDTVDFGVWTNFFLDADYEKNVHTACENLARAGIATPQFHLPGYDFFTRSDVIDERVEQSIHMALKLMHQMGGKWGAYHPLQTHQANYDHELSMEHNLDRMKGYLEVAEQYSVGIALENIPHFPDCPQYDFFASRVDEMCEFMDRLNSPYLGLCWDTGHNFLNIATPDKKAALNRLGDRIRILHVASNFGNNDWHMCPSLGHMDLDDVVPVLKKNGYTGTFNMELHLNLENLDVWEAYVHFCAQSADAILAAYDAAD